MAPPSTWYNVTEHSKARLMTQNEDGPLPPTCPLHTKRKAPAKFVTERAQNAIEIVISRKMGYEMPWPSQGPSRRGT